jgi:hypothetical protein
MRSELDDLRADDCEVGWARVSEYSAGRLRAACRTEWPSRPVTAGSIWASPAGPATGRITPRRPRRRSPRQRRRLPRRQPRPAGDGPLGPRRLRPGPAGDDRPLAGRAPARQRSRPGLISRPAPLPAGHRCPQRRPGTARVPAAGQADQPARLHAPAPPVPRRTRQPSRAGCPRSAPGRGPHQHVPAVQGLHSNPLRSRVRRLKSCRRHLNRTNLLIS